MAGHIQAEAGEGFLLLKYLTVVILPWVTIEVLNTNWRYLCLFLFLLFQLNVHVPVPPLRESEKKRIRKK